jgi:hypothetical protein
VAAEKINKGDFIIEYIGEGNLFYLTFAYILSSPPFFFVCSPFAFTVSSAIFS